DPCTRSEVCTYLDCGGRGRVSATCNGQRFTVESFPCNMTVTQCGTAMCGQNMICLEQLSGAATRQCVPNPCGTSAITCGCAGSLCARGWSCSAVQTTVSCTSTCPMATCP